MIEFLCALLNCEVDESACSKNEEVHALVSEVSQDLQPVLVFNVGSRTHVHSDSWTIEPPQGPLSYLLQLFHMICRECFCRQLYWEIGIRTHNVSYSMAACLLQTNDNAVWFKIPLVLQAGTRTQSHTDAWRTHGPARPLRSKVNRIRLGTPEKVIKGTLHRRYLDDITTIPLFWG